MAKRRSSTPAVVEPPAATATVVPAQGEPLALKVARALVQQASSMAEDKDRSALDAVLQSVGCSFDEYVGLTLQPEFIQAIQKFQQARDLPHLLAARTAVIEEGKGGNAYALKTAHDTSFEDPLEGDDKAYVDAMTQADARVLRREIRKLISEGISALERVDGKPYMLVEAPSSQLPP